LIDNYFVTAFKVLPNFKVHFGAQFIRVYGTTAVNAATTRFRLPKTLPARYSFTHREGWA